MIEQCYPWVGYIGLAVGAVGIIYYVYVYRYGYIRKFDIIKFCCKMNEKEQNKYLKRYWIPRIKRWNK